MILSYAKNEGTFVPPPCVGNTIPVDEEEFNQYSEWNLLKIPFQLNIMMGLEFNT